MATMKCPICEKPLGDEEKVELRGKGAAGINVWAEKKGQSLRVVSGTVVYTERRRKYTEPEKSDAPSKADTGSRRTRSSTGGFDFRLNCFLCGQYVTVREKQSGKVHEVVCKNREVDKAISDAILRRQNDEWSLEVKGRLDFVNDLRAEDAIYHGDCNTRFRAGRSNKALVSDVVTSSRKRGRPTIKEREEVFEEIAEYLFQNDDEQITIGELVDMMKDKVSGKPNYVMFVYDISSLMKATQVILFINMKIVTNSDVFDL